MSDSEESFTTATSQLDSPGTIGQLPRAGDTDYNRTDSHMDCNLRTIFVSLFNLFTQCIIKVFSIMAAP